MPVNDQALALAGRPRRGLTGGTAGTYSVIHPLSTSAPSSVRQRSRNGLAGMGATEKQPISSTGELVTPAVVCTSSVPARGGMICPRSMSSATSSSMDNPAEVKVSALISLGSAGVVASVVPVNDPATVPLMLALHDHLRGGSGLAQALTLARHAVSADSVAQSTAHSFIALGS